MISSWQTTLAGLGCIGAGAYLMTRGGAEALIQGAALIAAGIGLLRAQDASSKPPDPPAAKGVGA